MLANPMTVIVPEGSDDFTGNWREGCAGTGPFRVVGISVNAVFEFLEALIRFPARTIQAVTGSRETV